MGLPGGVGTELQQHRGAYGTAAVFGRLDERWVAENDGGRLPASRFRCFQSQLHWQPCRCDHALKQRQGHLLDPLPEPPVGCLRRLSAWLGLAAGARSTSGQRR